MDNTAEWVADLAPGADVLANLDAVLSNQSMMSYRDAVVVQLAFWLANNGNADITQRLSGGRSVSGWLGNYLAGKHIRAVKDAFQNIGKNTENLTRGNFKEFDQILQWGADPSRSFAEVEGAFRYACVKIAANARPILPMPELDRGRLTFGRVSDLISHLFATPSGGAYEQFGIAALLHALIEQQGETQYRVETKNLNASDRSSRSAGDVQIVVGNRVVEAIEVTANDWTEKLPSAGKTIRDNDLGRLTIVAAGVDAAGKALLDKLNTLDFDLSVLEVKGFAFSIVSSLTRPGRANALKRLYELLDRNQPKVEIVNQFVALIKQLELHEKLIKPH